MPYDLTLTRQFDASVDRVWDCWTEARRLERWFGPNDVDVDLAHFDLREGGDYRIVLRGRESGKLFPMRGVFEVIDPKTRLVFTHGWEDESGSVPKDTRITVTLSAKGTGTELVFTQTGLASEESRANHEDGWSQALENLRKYLEKVLQPG